MRIVKLTGGNIKIRESIKELPIDRFTDFQKYLVQDSGIGSDMGAVNNHFGKWDRLASAGKIDEAMRERHNLHMNIFLMINQINIQHITFCCLVDSVNSGGDVFDPITDYSESAMHDLSKKLGQMGLTHGDVADILESVKKNSILS